MSRKNYYMFTGGLVIVLVIAVLAGAVYRREQVRLRNEAGYKVFANILEERRKAPDFTLKDIEGGTIKLADLKGKALLINFRTTW